MNLAFNSLDMYGLNHEVHEASHTFIYYDGVCLLLTNNEHGHMKSRVNYGTLSSIQLTLIEDESQKSKGL